MAVSFANIFMAEIETKLIQQGKIKPRVAATYRLYPVLSPLCFQFFFEGRLTFNN